MNSEARALLKARRAEVDAFPGGEAAFRRHSLSNIRVKTVVKESHLSAVNCIVYNSVDGDRNRRLFATVGKDQATIYDDEHMGEHVAVVVQFQNAETAHTPGGALDVCAWVSSGGWQKHPFGDAVLAVAGGDVNISLISVVESRVLRLLRGHTAPITDLCGCPGVPGLLASLSKDGEIRVWDAAGGGDEAAAVGAVDGATSLCLSPDGSHAVAGTRSGRLFGLAGLNAAWGTGRKLLELVPAEPLELAPGQAHAGSPVDCVAFLSCGRLASKSADGRLQVWDASAENKDGAALRPVASWRVPSCSLDSTLRTRFGSDHAGEFVAVGNSQGHLYVYEAETGKKLAHVEPLKVSAPVRSCSISSDCRHVLAVMGNGFVFRYQYIQPPASQVKLEAVQEGNKENADSNAPSA